MASTQSGVTFYHSSKLSSSIPNSCIEAVTHIHQNWGPWHDHYDTYLKKIKKMLDPNTVTDGTAYIPPEYPDYDKDGDYVFHSHGKGEDI